MRCKLAGQGPSRRELIYALTLGSAAHAFPGFWRWSYALGEPKSESRALQPTYRPLFFSAAQYRTVELLAELILPATEEARHGKILYQPGAADAGVAEFVDFSVGKDVSLQAPFRTGLTWLDQASAPSTSFAASAAAAQNALLQRLAYKRSFREGDTVGQLFFQLIRKYVVMGFYTTEIGLRTLDYPGLTFYAHSPGCPHEGNPEHVGL